MKARLVKSSLPVAPGKIRLTVKRRPKPIATTYSQKLRDPRWQKMRLKILERDGWKCRCSGCTSPANTPLAVHHKTYIPGREPWEYPLTNFTTVCEQCHDQMHKSPNTKVAQKLVEGCFYAWSDLKKLLGFEPRAYLTDNGDKILCGCFRLDLNPDAPDIILPGTTESYISRAEKLAGQDEFIPVFVKAMDADWEYCGRYRVETVTKNAAEIAIHKARATERTADISMVLFLEKQPTATGKTV